MANLQAPALAQCRKVFILRQGRRVEEFENNRDEGLLRSSEDCVTLLPGNAEDVEIPGPIR
jgi:hypothetical protein